MNEKEINKAFDEEYIKYRDAFPKDYDIPALAQTQEPVAWMVYTQEGQFAFVTDNPAQIHPSQRALPLYVAPQRTWVGLTDEERQDIALEVPIDAVFITEAKLKEKNT
jgi:hypothetical protein